MLYLSDDVFADIKAFGSIIDQEVKHYISPINSRSGTVLLGSFTLENNPVFAKMVLNQLAKVTQSFEDEVQFSRLFEHATKPLKPNPNDYVGMIQSHEDKVPVLVDYTLDVQRYEKDIRRYFQIKRRSDLVKSMFRSQSEYLDFMVQIFKDIDAEIMGQVSSSDDLLLNHYRNKYYPVSFVNHTFTRHVFITGGTGSGKTNTLKSLHLGILKNRYRTKNDRKTATVLFDPHGRIFAEDEEEYYKDNYSRNVSSFSCFKDNPDDLIIIDPLLFEGYSPHFSPIRRPDNYNDELALDNEASNLQDCLKEILIGLTGADSSSKIFTENAPPILIPVLNLILHLEDAGLSDLLILLMDEKEARQNERFKELQDYAIVNLPSKMHREFFKDRIFKINPETKNALYNRLSTILNNPLVQRFFSGKSTFDFEQAIEDGKTIVFSFQRGSVSPQVITTIGQFISYQLLSYVFRRKGGSTPVNLVYDECEFFLSDTTIDILTQVRKYNLHLIMATQQIDRIPKKIREAIVNNSGSLIAGKNAGVTAKVMTEQLNLSKDDIINLNNYNFYAKIDAGQKKIKTFRLQIPFISGQNHLMPYHDYLEILKQQKQKYYRKLENTERHFEPIEKSNKPYAPKVPTFKNKDD